MASAVLISSTTKESPPRETIGVPWSDYPRVQLPAVPLPLINSRCNARSMMVRSEVRVSAARHFAPMSRSSSRSALALMRETVYRCRCARHFRALWKDPIRAGKRGFGTDSGVARAKSTCRSCPGRYRTSHGKVPVDRCDSRVGHPGDFLAR